MSYLCLDLNYSELDPFRGKRRRISQPEYVNSFFDKLRVVEVYSDYFEEKNEPALRHELLSNYEIGTNLADLHHPKKRYIWSLDESVTNKAIRASSQNTFNLSNGDPENPMGLTSLSKLIIVAQGNVQDEKIANLDSEAFVEMLQEDLGAKDIAELELVVCKIGTCEDYMDRIKADFKTTRLICYTSLLSSDRSGKVIGFDDENQYIENLSSTKRIL